MLSVIDGCSTLLLDESLHLGLITTAFRIIEEILNIPVVVELGSSRSESFWPQICSCGLSKL